MKAIEEMKYTALLYGGVIAIGLSVNQGVAAQERIRVVATLPTYAAIATEVAGNLGDVRSIARGDEDPHFVNARPSFAAMIQRADVFISTGLDLELWVPALLDRANNRKVVPGGPGHVVAYAGIKLLDVPQNVSRAGGDVHVFGNPHVHSDPINGVLIARNILAVLKRVDPANAATYESNTKAFEDRVIRSLFGDEMVDLLGTETLFDLALSGQFWEFVENQSFQGQPLSERVGGWLGKAAPFRSQRMVCYHKNWAYFSARFRVTCAEYIEPKPGIPPTPGHVNHVIQFIEQERIPVLFAANFFSRKQIDRVATRAGIRAVIVPEHVSGETNIDDYWTLVDTWVSRLSAAFESTMTGHP